MDVLLAIVCIVAGILNLILFFKVWGMTNDVDKMKKRFINKYEDLSFTEVNSELGKYIIKGDKDGAKSFLTECLLSQLVTISDNSSAYNFTYKLLTNEYAKFFAKIGEKKLPYGIDDIDSVEFRQMLKDGLK